MRAKVHVFVSIALILVVFPAVSCMAGSYDIGGNQLNLLGYISQTAQYSIEDDHWDTQEGFNAFLTTIFAEADYAPSGTVRFYAAAGLTADLAYQVFSGDDDWERKGFDDSDNLEIDDEWWQIVKEAHITWTPGDFMIRVGKQQVRWGEMEWFGVNDVIMPTDSSRGYGETELEALYVPIPLLRVDYYSPTSLGLLENLTGQLIFNPNVDHIPTRFLFGGNDVAGIWAANFPGPDIVDAEAIGFGPGSTIDRPTGIRAAELFDPTNALGMQTAMANNPTLFTTTFGRFDLIEEEMDSFDPDFFEYGIRLSTTIGSGLFSVMGFYGRENSPVVTGGEAATADSFTVVTDDGDLVWNFLDRAYYPRQKFVGVAWADTLDFLRMGALGGVEPVLRLEARYQFDKTYFNFNNWLDEFLLTGMSNFKSNLVESDLFVGGINCDFKLKAPWQKAFFFFQVEANFNDILDHKDSWGIGDKKTWHYGLYASTSYFNAKLAPSFTWYSEAEGDVEIYTPAISYRYSTPLSFELKANIFDGNEPWYNNKDHILIKVTYRWG